MPLGYGGILTIFICSSLITEGLFGAENYNSEVIYCDFPSFSHLHWLP